MKHRHILLTFFLLCVFFLHTATLGFAVDSEEPTPDQEAAEKAYHQSVTNLNTKWTNYDLVHDEFKKINTELEKVGNSISAAEAKVVGSVLLTAAGVLSGLGTTAVLARTAATITSLKNAAETLKNISTLGSAAALKDLQQSAYDLETEVIDRVLDVKTQAEKVNTKLSEWEVTLPKDEAPIFDDEEVVPIDVEAKYKSLPQTHELAPPSDSKDSTVATTCRGCSDVVERPWDDSVGVPSLGGDAGTIITVTVYRDHGVECPETHHSRGQACDGVYFTCPSPYPGTVTVCPNDADHRVVGPCPDGSEKHAYAKGSSGDHGQRVVCGVPRGVSYLNSAGKRVQDTCQEPVWACDRHEHGDHSFTEFELAAGSLSENYICANPSCVYTDSESSGSNSSSSALPVEWSDTYRLALSARAWGALHWNHRVSLGIGAAPVGSGSPTLSYEHQRTCVGGHTYWSCDVSELILHGSRTCPTAGCGETYSDCLNTSGSCLAGGYHASAPLARPCWS